MTPGDYYVIGMGLTCFAFGLYVGHWWTMRKLDETRRCGDPECPSHSCVHARNLEVPK